MALAYPDFATLSSLLPIPLLSAYFIFVKYICDCLEYGSRLKPTGRFGHLVTFNEPREQAIVSSSSSSSSSGGAVRKGMSTYSRPAKSQPSQTTVSVPVAAYSPSASEKGRAGRPRKCSTPIIEYDSNCNHDCNGSTDLNGNGASREIKNGQLLYSASQNIPTYTARSGIANGRRNIDNERKRKRNRESDNDKSEVATIKRRDRKVDDDNDDGSDVRNSDVSSDDGENTLCAPAVPAVGRVGSWAEL